MNNTNETSKRNSDKIAQTIIAQIKSLDYWFLVRVGYNSPSFSNNSLSFKVNGSKVGRAQVKITLNSMDTYDIEVFRVRKVKGRIEYIVTELGQAENCYWDSLVDCLKSLIEGE